MSKRDEEWCRAACGGSDDDVPPVTLARHDKPPRPGLYFARDEGVGWYAVEVDSIEGSYIGGDTAGLNRGESMPMFVEWLGPLEAG